MATTLAGFLEQHDHDPVRAAVAGADAAAVLVGADPDRTVRREWQLILETSWERDALRLVPVLLPAGELPNWLYDIQAVHVVDVDDDRSCAEVLAAAEQPTRHDADRRAEGIAEWRRWRFPFPGCSAGLGDGGADERDPRWGAQPAPDHCATGRGRRHLPPDATLPGPKARQWSERLATAACYLRTEAVTGTSRRRA